AYDRPNTNWADIMKTVFGLNVGSAKPGFDLIVTQDCWSAIHLRGMAGLGPIDTSFNAFLTTWKLWKNVNPTTSQVILSAFGDAPNGDCPYTDLTPYSALLVNSSGVGRGKTAVNPVAFGDTTGISPGGWDLRYALLHAIYRDYFGLHPVIDLSGPGSN